MGQLWICYGIDFHSAYIVKHQMGWGCLLKNEKKCSRALALNFLGEHRPCPLHSTSTSNQVCHSFLLTQPNCAMELPELLSCGLIKKKQKQPTFERFLQLPSEALANILKILRAVQIFELSQFSMRMRTLVKAAYFLNLFSTSKL